ncbi:hypothetical protein V6N12_057725 [Hibiscus sabdariffa]|uniref:Uncharacterized protein n=1 Tax=Hibiscus sabdariffa TaxID=183260 RepID=A0ABR2C7I8_9ROSI
MVGYGQHQGRFTAKLCMAVYGQTLHGSLGAVDGQHRGWFKANLGGNLGPSMAWRVKHGMEVLGQAWHSSLGTKLGGGPRISWQFREKVGGSIGASMTWQVWAKNGMADQGQAGWQFRAKNDMVI